MTTTPQPGSDAWTEDFSLPSGECFRMRPLRPDDKARIAEGLARLSPESQYLRFFTAKSRFTDAELRYLTEVDGWDHYAVGIARVLPDGTEGEGVAVGRFVRLPDEPEVAEPAVAVLDALQGRGLGRRLLQHLIAAAAAREVKRFRTEFLATNRPMKDLLEDLSPQARFVAEGALVHAEFPIAPAQPQPAGGPPGPLFEWLRLSASKAVTLRRRFAMLFDRAWVKAQLQRLGLAPAWLWSSEESEPAALTEGDAGYGRSGGDAT